MTVEASPPLVVDREALPKRHETLYHWLSAPLLLTVVGAILINLVIPKIMATSQNHQRALEVKTLLVREMSDAIAQTLTTGSLVATDVIGKAGTNAQGPFNQGLQAWQTSEARLAAELEAYFPQSDLTAAWRQYGRIVYGVYFLAATGVENRSQRVHELRGMLNGRDWCKGVPTIAWALLTSENAGSSGNAGARSSGFHKSYVALSSCVLAHGDDLVRSVLEHSPSGF